MERPTNARLTLAIVEDSALAWDLELNGEEVVSYLSCCGAQRSDRDLVLSQFK